MSIQPIRTLSKADIAHAMELLDKGMAVDKVARLANVRADYLESCLKRARAFGFDAWDSHFMYHIAQAV